MPDVNSLQPGRSVGGGRFVLARMLGRGGMGEVWLARDQRLEAQVALKFLPSQVRESGPTLEHLRLEAARDHRLTHPNIARLYDFHEPPGEPAFISMEYVDGASLDAVRRERSNKVLSWDYLRKVLAQLCAALDYAHGENVIHRDLKPDNVLMDSRGRLKLTDFGLAAMTSELARFGLKSGGGTLPYMSPQQLEGKLPQTKDDIYALGATLYELLTSQPPFHAGDVRQQILSEAPEPLRQRLAALGIENEIPHEVAAMVMSCLAKDPAQRPQSARSIVEWLGLSNEGARPDETPVEEEAGQRPAEVVSPKPGSGKILWAGAAAALVLIAGSAWFLKAHSTRPTPAVVAAPTAVPTTPTPAPSPAPAVVSTPATVPAPPTPAAVPTRAQPAGERWTNSLGMVFVPVPETEALFCIWKTRVQDYQAMVNDTRRVWQKPSFHQGPTHPAVNVKWEDARDFCAWLTQRERARGVIAGNQFYRLPTDKEWSLAVGLGHEAGNSPREKDGKISGVYPWGTDWPPPRGTGNFDPKLRVDDYPYTSPVGVFPSNAYGLYDMAGNAREWCEDFYAPGSQRRVVRGSSWFDTPALTLQSSRRALTPAERHDSRYDYFGFRCVLEKGAGQTPTPAASSSPLLPANALSLAPRLFGSSLLLN